MAKYVLRLKARELRSQGVSVKQIAKQLQVSKGTVSLWVRDIILTVKQLEKLHKSEIKGAKLGRLRNALLQKQKRLNLIEQFQEEGKKIIGKLTDRELLFTGLALYWGEGSKKNRHLELCNSDPKMIKFFIRWLQTCLGVEAIDLKCYVGINESHKIREAEVKEYWSRISGIPIDRFTKTSFKKVALKKVFENYNTHYGTLSVKVLKPARYYYKVLGLIDAIASQGSSAVRALHS